MNFITICTFSLFYLSYFQIESFIHKSILYSGNHGNDIKLELPEKETISFIRQYKRLLDHKEKIGDLIKNMNHHIIDCIFIDKDYKELVSIDEEIVKDGTISHFIPLNSLNKNEQQNVFDDNMMDMDSFLSEMPLQLNEKTSSDDLNTRVYNHIHVTSIHPSMVSKIIDTALSNNVDLKFVTINENMGDYLKSIGTVINYIIEYGLPIFILYTFFSMFLSFRNGTNGNISKSQSFFPFSSTSEEKNQYNKPNISLSNWAGSPEIIEECKEIIDYTANKDKFLAIGAQMPKGILLEGPPGTGKTMLAKAIATETNSYFIPISGSEFVELFVGMGSVKVRQLFQDARDNSPCIIFIDEIDAVGKKRSSGIGGNIGGGNDEREQTLNQLLYEMDGFKSSEDILVLAATNRKDSLDDALLRPGRFDRLIKIPLPDVSSREKIIDSYLKDKPALETINIKNLAEITDGYSGADLKNIINEALILAVRKNQTGITETEIFDSFEKSIIGLVKKEKTEDEKGMMETKTRVAIHESGHAFMAMIYNEYFDVQKVSIQSTYSGAGGYTLYSEKPAIKKDGLYTRHLLKKKLMIMLGGKAAESVYYGDDYVSMGSTNDLKQANTLAKRMIGEFGFGNRLQTYYNEPREYSGFGDISQTSENVKYQLDKESLLLVEEAYKDAKIILQSNEYKEKWLSLSFLLINQTTLNHFELTDFIINKLYP